jgi:uncharacterized membrane protein YGL010W
MKLSFKNRNIILLTIGFLLIGFAFFQMIFKIKVDAKISSYIQNGLFLLAAVIFFAGRKNKDEKIEENEEIKDNEENNNNIE